jgi:electron transfer flavoprotein alpha subunit
MLTTSKLKTNVFLNALSSSFEASSGAVGAFLKGHPELEIANYITLVKDFEGLDIISQRLGSGSNYVWLKTDSYQPETALEQFQSYDQDLALFPPGVFGSEMAGRLAARKRGSAVLGLMELTHQHEVLLAKKSVYSQNLTADFSLNNKPYCLSLAKEWFRRPYWAGRGQGKPGQDQLLSLPAKMPSHLKESQIHPFETTKDLSQAQTLIVAGFGLGGQDGVKAASLLAQAIGAEWGVSRPVAMNAWAPLDRLIGVSGSMTAPNWVLVLGASGAAALLSGLNRAKNIAAINIDPLAPIMSCSDLAVVGEAKEILAELLKLADQENC